LCPGALIESLKEQSRLAAAGTMEREGLLWVTYILSAPKGVIKSMINP
jgi:hypothetical protein